MDDFFTEFKDNLNKRLEPEFDENAWKAMAKKLDQKEEQPKAAMFWWWLLIPFLLLSLFFNGWLWANMKAKEARQNLTHEIHIDTIYHTKVVYKTDTVIQNRTIIEQVLVSMSEDTKTPSKGHVAQLDASRNMDLFKELTAATWPSFFVDATSNRMTELQNLHRSLVSAGGRYHHLNNNSNGTLLGGSSISTDANNSLWDLSVQEKYNNGELNASMKKHTDNSSGLFLDDLDLLPKLALTTLKYRQKYAFADIEPIVFKEKRTNKNLSYFFKPKGFQVGATAAWVSPFSNDFTEGSGSAIGLKAMLNFSTPLRLWASLNYYQASYKSNRMAEELDIPLVTAPSDDDNFKYTEVNHKSITYSIGLEYIFRKHKRLKPLIGAGYGIVHFLPQELYYEFENINTGLETKLEIPRPLSKRQFNNLFTCQAGIEYELWQQFHLQLMASYRTQLGTADLQVPEIFALKTGLFYQF